MPLNAPGPHRRALLGYLVAIGSVATVLITRMLLSPLLGDTPGVVLFLLPVGVASWFGGFGPGMLATVSGCVIGLTLFGQKPGSTVAEVTATHYWLSRAIPYTIVGTFISFLSDHLERARQSAEREKFAANHAREIAEQASRLKDDFLATISHELRTPLSAIVGWSSLLQQQLDASGAGPDDMMREGLEVIRRNARAQSQLIEDILDVARITSGKVRLEGRRVDLREPIEAALGTVRTAADAKGVTLRSELEGVAPVVISGDPDRLQQIFWNLLSNAIKFTDAGGCVQLTMRALDRNRVMISIIDDGHGMDEAFVPYVFERFRQADMSTTRRQGGLGLGLAIVRQLVELHGGEVAAFSEGMGKGSRFEVTLPVVVAPTSSGALPGDLSRTPDGAFRDDSVGRSLRGSRVLVVDDDPDARRVIEAALLQSGTRVTSVDSVDAALTALGKAGVNGDADGLFSAIVSDIGMPGADGYAFIRQVRNGENVRGGPRVPALALTAYTRDVDRAQTLAAGFDGFLAKPAEPEVLLRTVAAMVERRSV